MNYFTRNRVLTLVLMLLVTINLAALTMIGINNGFFGEAKADSRKPREERRHREKTGRMMESRLGLNDEQKIKLDATRKEHMHLMRALSTKMDEARDEMEQELNETIIDFSNDQIPQYLFCAFDDYDGKKSFWPGFYKSKIGCFRHTRHYDGKRFDRLHCLWRR